MCLSAPPPAATVHRTAPAGRSSTTRVNAATSLRAFCPCFCRARRTLSLAALPLGSVASAVSHAARDVGAYYYEYLHATPRRGVSSSDGTGRFGQPGRQKAPGEKTLGKRRESTHLTRAGIRRVRTSTRTHSLSRTLLVPTRVPHTLPGITGRATASVRPASSASLRSESHATNASPLSPLAAHHSAAPSAPRVFTLGKSPPKS